jgi:L-phenylalanine/L-methionine N-acetyltransferase
VVRHPGSGQSSDGGFDVEGVTIRHAEVGDAEAFHRIMTGPRVVAGTLQLPFQTVERTRRFLAESPEHDYVLVAVADGEVIGNLDLSTKPHNPRTRHVGYMGMAVRDDWQGKGIGTALMQAALDLADNWLNLTRIELHVYTDNAAGVALYEKFGFTIEGTHRCFAFRDGEYADAYSMARITNRNA